MPTPCLARGQVGDAREGQPRGSGPGPYVNESYTAQRGGAATGQVGARFRHHALTGRTRSS